MTQKRTLTKKLDSTREWVVRFGYDGAPYAGWARQPGQTTVEGTIRDNLIRCGIVSHIDDAVYRVASRTDRGVHARGNVLLIRTSRSGKDLLSALNGIAPPLFFTRAAMVPSGSTFRSLIVDREYRYYERGREERARRWQEYAQYFLHRSMDVRSFSRGRSGDAPQWRTVSSLEIRSGKEGVWVQIRAPSFVWGMVRKIVGALRLLEEKRLDLGTLEEALAGKRRLTLPLAEPERLVLWEVRLSVPWTISMGEKMLSRMPGKYLGEEGIHAQTRQMLLYTLTSAFSNTEEPARSSPTDG